MADKSFDTSKKDAQATVVEPVKLSDFSLEAYLDYENSLAEGCRNFIKNPSGVLVYRRMRAAEVFSYGCRDMDQSLEWQLGALKKSMDYKADVPNFLEPWYGIGLVASAFDINYIWNPGQAPATKPGFQTVEEALSYDARAIKDTKEGRHTLNMIDYFLEQTKGMLPMSFSDIQSPFNNATCIVDTSDFLTSMILEPDKALRFLDMLADLIIDFYKEQEKLIGDALVRPGHGFASSRFFEGFGMSDDNIVMVDSDTYLNFVCPSFEKVGKAFGGAVLHSCGNFSDKVGLFAKIKGLKMVDAAFTAETDPSPNPATPFTEALTGTGIILNARMVGDPGLIKETVSDLWSPGMKMIAVTFSQSRIEQQQVYDNIHFTCQQNR
jgi:hypothetical protein